MQPVPARTAMSPPAPASPRFPVESGQRAGTVPAELLFQGSQEILIGHNGDTYRLRITKNGKLILTK